MMFFIKTLNYMYIKLRIITLISFFNFSATCQVPESLLEFQYQRLNYQKNGMVTLASWALANMTVGTIGYYTSSGESRYFHQMNAGWNIVNLGLAISGYLGAKKEAKQTFTHKEIFFKQQKTEHLFLFNNALNFTYITAGLLLMERAKNDANNFHRFQGFGSSLIVQGSFLLAFDTFNFILHRKHGKRKLY